MATENKKAKGLPDFGVWVYGMPGEEDLEAAAKHNEARAEDGAGAGTVTVHMMRRQRQRNKNSLLSRVPIQLKVLKVTERRSGNSLNRSLGDMCRELEVEVEMVGDAPKGVLIDGVDDGKGLSAFKAGTKFTLVYRPQEKTRMARVSHGSDVLYA